MYNWLCHGYLLHTKSASNFTQAAEPEASAPIPTSSWALKPWWRPPDAIWLQPDIPRFIPFPDELGIAWPFGVYTWVYHIFQAHPCWWCWCRYAEVWWCSTKKRHDWTIGAHGSSVLLEVPILDCHIPKSLCGWHTFSSHSKQVSLLQSSFRVSVKKKIDHNRPM